MNVNQHCSRIQDIQDELDELHREQVANIARNIAHVAEQDRRNREQALEFSRAVIPDTKLDITICTGCGYVSIRRLRVCPKCSTENNSEPFYLLTLREMLEWDGEYWDVRLDKFLKSLFLILKIEIE